MSDKPGNRTMTTRDLGLWLLAGLSRTKTRAPTLALLCLLKRSRRTTVRRSTLALSLLLPTLLLITCTLAPRRPVFTSPLDTHLPIVAAGPNPATSPKKGVSLWPGSCDLLQVLGASWYYAGRDCPNVERVPYLDTRRALELAAESQPPENPRVMFWNEPDLAHWHTPPIEELVSLFVAVEKNWTGKTWIGPCFSSISPGSILCLRQFWTEYQRQTGHQPDPKTHRLCLHCYGSAAHCLHQIDTHLSSGAIFGLDTLWLPEMGMHLGLYASIDDARRQNEELINHLEQNPQVERYAYWSAMIPSYGYHVPSKPISGFHPLAFYWLREDGTKEERLTDMGEWYATVPREVP